MRHLTITLLIAPLLTAVPAIAAPTAVSVAKVAVVSVAGRALSSSSQLAVTWTPSAGDNAHHFEVVAREAVQGTEVRASAAASATGLPLTGLKAATTYSVTVLACPNQAS